MKRRCGCVLENLSSKGRPLYDINRIGSTDKIFNVILYGDIVNLKNLTTAENFDTRVRHTLHCSSIYLTPDLYLCICLNFFDCTIKI